MLTKATTLLAIAFLATSFGLAIVAGEYILRWLPRGSHQWRKFVRPSELAAGLRQGGIDTEDISGLSFNPLTDEWRVSSDVSINYILFGTK